MFTILLCKLFYAVQVSNYEISAGMKKQWFKQIQKFPSWTTNPYLIAAVLFTAWMLFFDDNNLVSQYRKHHELNDLLEKRNYYREQIAITNQAYAELTTNKTTQEKFAREHYRMKRDNEDVFVIVPAK